MTPLLHVPIATGGQFQCSSPFDGIYLVEFESPPDNRLTPSFNEAFLLMLDLIESRLPKGVVVTTSKLEKFYSNGLELSQLGDPSSRSSFFMYSLFPLLARLLSYSMPTVALINGHAFAGGFIVALHHDYRIQNPSKGYLCMNEVLLGVNMDPALLGIFRTKVTSPSTYRSLILEGHRFTSQQGFEEGLVDSTGGLDAAVAFIKERDLIKKGQSGVYGGLKEEMYRDQLGLLRSPVSSGEWGAAASVRRENHAIERDQRLKSWTGKLSGSKL